MQNPVTDSAFDQLDPTILKTAIRELIKQYQENRSKLIAWIIVHYAEALSRHPDCHEIQEEGCNYQRFSHQWRWFAQQDVELQADLTPVTHTPSLSRS